MGNDQLVAEITNRPGDGTSVHFTPGPAQFALGQYEPASATGARFNFEVTIRDGNELGFVQK